ncbi:hypothetical protein LR48_Vigan08g066100 [Vigna angularis]|uniref:Uncharacterized protein n=1 Tax=Phaseolus angularis TaxID=3914 RepID=A0A0L9V549_PHAAN|nr:hypothetical protein LR48_Vigan08g066100 [Vigna angularis]
MRAFFLQLSSWVAAGPNCCVKAGCWTNMSAGCSECGSCHSPSQSNGLSYFSGRAPPVAGNATSAGLENPREKPTWVAAALFFSSWTNPLLLDEHEDSWACVYRMRESKPRP